MNQSTKTLHTKYHNRYFREKKQFLKKKNTKVPRVPCMATLSAGFPHCSSRTSIQQKARTNQKQHLCNHYYCNPERWQSNKQIPHCIYGKRYSYKYIVCFWNQQCVWKYKVHSPFELKTQCPGGRFQGEF